MALGHFAAPHIKKQSDKVLPKSWQKKDGAGASKIDSITDVAVGGLQGFRVYVQELCLSIELIQLDYNVVVMHRWILIISNRCISARLNIANKFFV